jgi:hypothetical protein
MHIESEKQLLGGIYVEENPDINSYIRTHMDYKMKTARINNIKPNKPVHANLICNTYKQFIYQTIHNINR